MKLKKEKDWKPRTVRMPDELWFEIMKQAKLKGLPTAEYIRRKLT